MLNCNAASSAVSCDDDVACDFLWLSQEELGALLAMGQAAWRPRERTHRR